MKKWHIFFIMWVTGAWKWTLIDLFKKSDYDIHLPLSCKSRKPRDFEVDWVDAHFLTEEEFKKRIEKWEFLEHAFVHNWGHYWTLIEDVYDNWILLWKTVLKELDYNWLVKLQKENPDFRKNYTTIFLNIPNEEIWARVIARWEKMTEEDYKNRIASAEIERWDLNIYDYIIDSHAWHKQEVFDAVLEIIKNK